MVQEGLYDLQCQASAPPTPKHDKAESPTEAVPGTHSFFPLPAFSLLPPAPKIREGSSSLQAGQALKTILWVSTGLLKGEQPTSFLPS